MVYRALTLPADSGVYRDAAARHALPLSLVLAITEIESSFQIAAFNPEPPYRYLWDIAKGTAFRALTADELVSEVPPDDFCAPRGVPRDAEWWGQQASWGLMQMMGGVARELGYDGPWLTELVADPMLAVDLGCRHLARKVKLFGQDDLVPAIAAYNAGSPQLLADTAGRRVYRNQDYVNKGLAALTRWRAKLKE